MAGTAITLKDKNDQIVYPVTSAEIVYMSDGVTNISEELESSVKFERYDDESVAVNYPGLDTEVQSVKESINVLSTSLDNIVQQKATKTEVDVERKRIDSFTSLAQGSTTGDAELIDGRTGNNAIKYSNIGGAIREQIKNLENGGVNDRTLKPVKTSFITNNAIYYKSRCVWQTTAVSSYGTYDITIENLSFKKPLYVNIGNSDAIDKNSAVAIVRAYSNDYQNGTSACGTSVINASNLGKNVSLPNNGWTINKVVVSLYSSFATVIPANTITTVTDIILKSYNEDLKYTLNNINVKKSDIIDDWTIITVKKDGTGDFTNPLTATNHYFSDTWNGAKKVMIQIYEGEYDIFGAWEDVNKTGWYITGANVGWNINSNIKLVGIGDRDKIICKCYQSDNTQYATSGSCINMNWGGEVENISFLAKNCRYTCHSDNSNYYKNLKYNIKNCVFKHLGNASGLWEWHGAWMEGSSSGNDYLFEECEFYGVRGAYGTHTNTGFTIPSVHRFKNCKFFNDTSNINSVNFECMGSGVKNKVYLEGNYIQRSIGLVENPVGVGIDTEIMGHGNSKVTINNPKNATIYITDI